MKDVVIPFNEEVMANFGSNSLSGKIANASPDEVATKATLIFEQSSMEWKRKHNGPNLWIMPEHAILEMVKDIDSLINRGVTIECKTVTKDPS